MLGLRQVRHRQEDVGVRDEEVLEVHPRVALGRVDHRDAGTTVVRVQDHRLEAEHVGHVVLEHLGVAHEAVAPAEWLVGEAEAREVHRADAVAVAQSALRLRTSRCCSSESHGPARAAARRRHRARRGRPAPRRHLRCADSTRSTCPCHATRLPDSSRDSLPLAWQWARPQGQSDSLAPLRRRDDHRGHGDGQRREGV